MKKEDDGDMPIHPDEDKPYLFNAEFSLDLISKPLVIPCRGWGVCPKIKISKTVFNLGHCPINEDRNDFV